MTCFFNIVSHNNLRSSDFIICHGLVHINQPCPCTLCPDVLETISTLLYSILSDAGTIIDTFWFNCIAVTLIAYISIWKTVLGQPKRHKNIQIIEHKSIKYSTKTKYLSCYSIIISIRIKSKETHNIYKCTISLQKENLRLLFH